MRQSQKVVQISLCLLIGLSIAAVDKPTPPADSTVVTESETYLVYRLPNGEMRILFDTRAAWTSTPAPDRPDSLLTPATSVFLFQPNDLDSEVLQPFVWEGLHRAVGASHGNTIRKSLGGTGVGYWLDYQYNEHMRREDLPRDIPIRRLSEFNFHLSRVQDVGLASNRNCNQSLGTLGEPSISSTTSEPSSLHRNAQHQKKP